MDDEIRRHVESMLAERYPQFEVSVGGARVLKDKGIAIYDVSLALPGGGRNDDPLLSIDELVLICDVEWAKLVQGAPNIHRVEVKSPQLAVRRTAGGRWNVESLLPSQPCGQALPQIVIRGGTVSVDDGSAETPPLSLTNVDATVTPVEQASAPGEWPSVRVEGQASGPMLKRVELTATLDGKQRLFNASGSIRQMQLADALAAWVTPMLPPAARATRVSGTLDGSGTVAWKFDGRSLPQFSSTLALSSGRIEDPRLLPPVTELAGKIVVDSQRLQLENIHGKWGVAAVALSLNRSGWSAAAPMAVSARAANVPLDDELYQELQRAAHPQNALGIHLADDLRKEWDHFSPTGVVDATVQATFVNSKWHPKATLAGRQLTFESDKFAYRLTDGNGTIRYACAENGRPPQVDIDLTGVGGGERLRIVGQVFDPKPEAAGWAQITGEGLELDEKLIAAVDGAIAEASEHGQATPIIASLHPAGKFNLAYWRIDRRQPGAEPETKLRLDLTDVRINYEQFPYPLREIRGVIEAHGHEWTFSNFVSGGYRTIYGEGSLKPTAEGRELWLRFTGQNVPLDDSLFYSLQTQGATGQSPAQKVWQMLQPRGAVNLVAQVQHRIGVGKPRIGVVIQPTANSSVKPVFFPYLLDDVSGTFSYSDEQVVLQDVKAHHDSTAMGANGSGRFSPDGGWEFKLSGLWADRISTKSDLLNALPERLRSRIEQLRPSGGFGLHNGELVFRQTPVMPLKTTWDMQLECHQADINCGVELHNIHGSVRLIGEDDSQRTRCSGELALETATYQDVQVTNVKGPLWIDESECRLGKWATERTGEPMRAISGSMYGGTLSGNGLVQLGASPKYQVEANLVGADLSRMMIERVGGGKAYSGKVDGSIVAHGDGPSIARFVGQGNVHVREANIYELPLLIGLLKTVRTGDPSQTAFNESNVAFRIQGPHITLDQIDFLGDVVDLYGYGVMEFNQDIKMIFRSEVFLRDYRIPFVKNLVGQASQNIMQMYVDGKLTNPHVTTEALPGFKQLLQQIKSDLENPAGSMAARQNLRGAR